MDWGRGDMRDLTDDSDFQFLLDPFTGRIVLVSPSPMVCFENLESFEEFVEMLNKVADTLSNQIEDDASKRTIVRCTKIDPNYAKEVIDAWQTQMIGKNFPERGPEKHENGPKNSTSQDKP